MDLQENPFYILGANIDDDRARILELADERSLTTDADVCNGARSTLTNPSKRIVAEVGWLIGEETSKIKEIQDLLQKSPREVFEITDLSDLAKVNAYTAAIKTLLAQDKPVNYLTELIEEIAEAFEKVDYEQLTGQLNDGRERAGISPIRDETLVQEALRERSREILSVLKDALDLLESRKLVNVMTDIVQSVSKDGTDLCPGLVEELVNTYEIYLQDFFSKEEANADTLIEKIESNAADGDETFQSDLTLMLSSVVKNWASVAKPLEIHNRSIGKEYQPNIAFRSKVRNFAVNFYNAYGRYNIPRRIIEDLSALAEYSPEFQKLLDEDIKFLSSV